MKISIGSDHAGYDVKQKIINFLLNKGYDIDDVGCHSDDSVDYPEFGHQVGKNIVSGVSDKGIVVCGSGIGISIAANKIKGIRAALCTSILHAELSRKHNNSNILALGARMTELKTILDIVDAWIKTDFEGGRHFDRIQKIEK